MPNIRPKAFIFCYNDSAQVYYDSRQTGHQDDGGQSQSAARGDEDAEAEDLSNFWFANQVIDDACATLAVLNLMFNLDDPAIGFAEQIEQFRAETREFSGVVS
jgi:ubiquitin carboxyl-terminal hydrolase L5